MALLTTQEISASGTTPSYASANAGGDTFNNSATTFAHYKNGSGGELTLTFASTVSNPRPGLAASNFALAIPAGQERMVWLSRKGFNNADERVSVSYSGVTSLTVAILKMPG